MRYHTFDLTVSATGVPHEYLISARCTQGQAEQRAKIEVEAASLSELVVELQSRGPSSGSAGTEKSRHLIPVQSENAIFLSAKLKHALPGAVRRENQ